MFRTVDGWLFVTPYPISRAASWCANRRWLLGRKSRRGTASNAASTLAFTQASAEARDRPCLGLGCLDLTVLGRGGRGQRVDQPLRGHGDVMDGVVERVLVDQRGLRAAADLAHVLQRSRVDLVGGGRR